MHINFAMWRKASWQLIKMDDKKEWDALDVVSMAENLPDLVRGDLVYSVNIGAYSHASATYFNGFPPAKVVHENL